MRHVLPMFAAVALLGCGEAVPATEPTGTISLEAQSDVATQAVFNTRLLAENEPNNSSSSQASGFAQIRVLEDDTILFMLVIHNPAGEILNQAHIHKAPAGFNAGVHWDLFLTSAPPLTGAHEILRGEATPRTAANPQLSDLLEHPENYYVNVHSTDEPAGAIRGQLQ